MESSQPASQLGRNAFSDDQPHKRPKLGSIRQYSAEEHAEMDEAVGIAAKRMTLSLSNPLTFKECAFFLLSAVVESCDSLDQTYKQTSLAASFLDKNPAVIEMLEDAYRNNTYQSIRELELLQCPVSRPTLGDPIYRNAVERAWNLNYQTDCHEVLLNKINKFHRHNAFSNIATIVQSSGTGKSRMVDEMAKLIFTIPINLRDPNQIKDGHVYPDPDEALRDLFLEATPDIPDRTERWFLRILASLFTIVTAEVKKITGGRQMDEAAALATLWRNHLLDRKKRQDLYARIVGAMGDGFADFDDYDRLTVWDRRHQTRKSLQTLISALKLLYKDANMRAVHVVMYIDEAHEMCKVKAGYDRCTAKTLYDIFCSTISYLYDEPFIAIFLSTSSHLTLKEAEHPTPPFASSSRTRGFTPYFQVPITALPFDCHPDLLVKPGDPQLDSNKVNELGFMARFGRPLFWSLLECNPNIDIVELARSKITAYVDYTAPWLPSYQSKQDIVSLACIDIRLNFNYSSRDLSLDTESELVASHMRIAYLIPEGSKYMRSGYSSEPILAEAAAQQLCYMRRRHSIPEILRKHVGKGLFDNAEPGQLVTRAILTMAYDAAVEHEVELSNNQASSMEVIYSRGCSVVHFIEALFQPDIAQEFLDSRPNNVVPGSDTDKTLRDAFKDARLRFTHFVKADDDEMHTTQAMLVAWIRCMAIICEPSQDTVTFLLPVLLKLGPLGEEVMSAFLIQCKSRIQEGLVNEHFIEAGDIGFFLKPAKGQPPDERPYITLALELRMQEVEAAKWKLERGNKQYEQQRTKANRRHTRNNHPRYSLYAYGCSSMVYQVIRPEEKSTYTSLLATRDIFSEHARQDPNSMQLLTRMKPLWSDSPDCFHWLESPYSDHVPAQEDEEGVDQPQAVEAEDRSFAVVGNMCQLSSEKDTYRDDQMDVDITKLSSRMSRGTNT